MRSSWSICVLLALLGAASAASGSAASLHERVRVRYSGPDPVEVGPAERVNVVFRVSSSSTRVERLRFHARAPDGWSVSRPLDLELTPDSTALRVVSVAVPATAAAGTYVLYLDAHDPSGDVAGAAMIIRVPERVRLSVRAVEQPAYVLPNRTYAVRFAVVNSGNARVQPSLDVVASGGAKLLSKVADPFIEPGDEAVVELQLLAPPELRTAAHTVRLAASAGDQTVRGSVRVQVESGGAAPARHALPGQLRFRMSDEHGTAPGVALQLAGPLREGSETRLDVLLQRPTQRYGLLGEQQLYRAALTTPNASLRVGDHTFSLSRLTEPGRSGQGVAATVSPGPVTLGGFVQRARFTMTPHTQQAAFGRIQLGAPLMFGVNWVNSERNDVAYQVWSVETRVVPVRGVSLNAEYATTPQGEGHAHNVEARVARGRVSATARHLRADTALGTPIAGNRADALSVSVRLPQRLRLDASVQQAHYMRSTGTLRYAREQQSSRLALTHARLGSVELRHMEIAGHTGASLTDREAYSARVRGRLPVGRVTIMPGLELGEIVNRVTDEASTFWRADAQARVGGAWGSLAAGVEYQSGGTLHAGTASDRITTSLNASLLPRGATRLTLGAGRTTSFGEYDNISTHANATLERSLPAGHRVAVRGMLRQWEGSHSSGRHVLAIDYSLPLRVPVSLPPPSGTIRGRVIDGETGEPVEGVLMEIGGRRARTNAGGSYEIRGLATAPVTLGFDRWTAGVGRTTAEPLPAFLTPAAGGTTTVDIMLVRSAALSLSAVVVTPARGVQDTATHTPLGGIILELERDGERVRRVMDAKGHLLLDDLRPGDWKVHATSTRLPPFHRFEADTLRVTLTPGAHESLQLRVVPIERRVIRLDVGAPSVVAEAEPPGRRDMAAQPTSTAAVSEPQGRSAPAPAREPRPAPQPRTRERRPVTRVNNAAALPSGWTRVTVPRHVTTLMGLAREHYRETGLWPKIWLANRSSVRDPMRIEPGSVLVVPPKEPLTPHEEQVLQQYLRSRWR